MTEHTYRKQLNIASLIFFTLLYFMAVRLCWIVLNTKVFPYLATDSGFILTRTTFSVALLILVSIMTLSAVKFMYDAWRENNSDKISLTLIFLFSFVFSFSVLVFAVIFFTKYGVSVETVMFFSGHYPENLFILHQYDALSIYHIVFAMLAGIGVGAYMLTLLVLLVVAIPVLSIAALMAGYGKGLEFLFIQT